MKVAYTLRVEHQFRGYIHLKTIPEAAPELVAEAGRWADRISINVELPTQTDLQSLASTASMWRKSPAKRSPISHSTSIPSWRGLSAIPRLFPSISIALHVNSYCGCRGLVCAMSIASPHPLPASPSAGRSDASPRTCRQSTTLRRHRGSCAKSRGAATSDGTAA